MKKHLLKIRLFISILFFIFFCIIFVYLYKQINNNTEETIMNTKNLQDELSKRDGISSLNRSLQKILNSRNSLETHFAKNSDIVPFLDTIEQLASKVGAKADITSVSTGGNNTFLFVNLNATGSFEAIYKFLTLLENSPYELEFPSLDLHKIPNTAEVGKISSPSKWEAVLKIKLVSFMQ